MFGNKTQSSQSSDGITNKLYMGLILSVIIGGIIIITFVIDKTEYTEESITYMWYIWGNILISIMILFVAIKTKIKYLYVGSLLFILVALLMWIFKIEKIGGPPDTIIGQIGSFVSAIKNPKCEEQYKDSAKDYLIFSDPIEGGTCWACPKGYKRTGNPVNGPNACVKTTSTYLINSVQKPIEIKDPVRDTKCKDGYSYSSIKKVCWKCPDGYKKVKFPIDPKKTCYKIVKGKKIGPIQLPKTIYSPPSNVELPTSCPEGYVPKKDILGKVVKCLKPPNKIEIIGNNSVVGTITEIGGTPINDPSLWVPVLLNNNLRLTGSAIKQLENEGYKLDIKTPDLFYRCPQPTETERTIRITVPGQPDKIKVVTANSKRTINPDLRADNSCEILTNAFKLGSINPSPPSNSTASASVSTSSSSPSSTSANSNSTNTSVINTSTDSTVITGTESIPQTSSTTTTTETFDNFFYL